MVNGLVIALILRLLGRSVRSATSIAAAAITVVFVVPAAAAPVVTIVNALVVALVLRPRRQS